MKVLMLVVYFSAFDKGIIFKLKHNGTPGNLSNLLSSFLRNGKQRVVLNGQTSSWVDVNARLPQGSMLGLVLFLMYIYHKLQALAVILI